MKIYRDINNFKVKIPVLSIGTFDGVHLGHLQIIKYLIDISDKVNGESVILTFWPHPRHVLFNRGEKTPILTTIDERIERFKKSGIDHLIIHPFTVDFAKLSGRDFIEKMLIKQLNIKHLVVGYDHQFGKDRQGSIELLENYRDNYFKIYRVDPHKLNGINISSTKIRRLLEQGDIQTANMYLGYNYSITGKVVKGDMLGSKLGFPTANIQLNHFMKHVPGVGVYAVFVYVNNKKYDGMLNIGYRPTISRNFRSRQIEVHIFNFHDNLYGKNITVSFIDRIRDEIKFDNTEKLKEQLTKDEIITKSIIEKYKSEQL
ncbi:MAG: bifunctional riboflavin kinase/FAD synthetase [Marinilabiliales bacterium]